MADKTWDQAKAEAMDILGKKAKIPEMKAYSKATADFNKAQKEYYAAVENIQDKILAYQNSQSSIKNMFTQHGEKLSASKVDFGLDGDSKEDKEKIEKAKKVLTGALTAQSKICEENIKNLDGLDKHTMSLANYEATKCG